MNVGICCVTFYKNTTNNLNVTSQFYKITFIGIYLSLKMQLFIIFGHKSQQRLASKWVVERQATRNNLDIENSAYLEV